MKKLLPIILIGVVVLLAAVVFYVIKNNSKTPVGSEETAVEEENYVTVPVAERPYITLTPRNDGHEISLRVSNFGSIPSLEYKLEYLAGEMERGVGPSKITLKGETSITRNLLLGSCSKNVCKYDENVTQGTITIILHGDKPQKYVLPFTIKKGSEVDGLILGEKKAVLTGKLVPSVYYIMMSMAGLPAKFVTGEVLDNSIAIFSSSSTTFKGAIKIKSTQIVTDTKIYGWNGTSSKWIEYSKVSEAGEGFLSVEIDRLTTFILVNPQ